MILKKEELVIRIYNNEQDEKEVLEYLNAVAPLKEGFRDETTLINFTARKLQPKFKTKVKKSKSSSEYSFGNNRLISLDTIHNPINKEKNVLWCIRLLSGKCEVPHFSEDTEMLIGFVPEYALGSYDYYDTINLTSEEF